MTGVDMVHVPYRGVAQAITDLLGGQVQVMFDTTAASIGYIGFRRLQNSYPVTRRVRSTASVPLWVRRPKSSIFSIAKSTPASHDPGTAR
jgi:hypothetical protein